jgi:hypothetical protein
MPPAKTPNTNDKNVEINGLKPDTANFAKTKAPSEKLPSTVKSAISNILYVSITPIARTENISPCSMDVSNKFIITIVLLI